jgi:hypothetical protein
MPAGPSRAGSAVAIARDGARTLAYAADEDGRALHTFDLDARRALAVTPLDGAPARVTVLADGRVAVTLSDQDRIAILEPPEDPRDPLDTLCAAAPADPIATSPVGMGRACALPRAAAARGDRSLLVACLGIDAVIELDPKAAEVRRFGVPSGPTGLVVDEGRAVVWSQFAHVLSIIELDRPDGRTQAIVPRQALPGWPTGEVARGRLLFYARDDARMTGADVAALVAYVRSRSSSPGAAAAFTAQR